MKETIKKIPIIGPFVRKVYRVLKPIKPFLNSESYWEDRYKSGGSSGAGSFGKLAKYKAEIINDFVCKNTIQSIIEHGCGDGNQLKLAKYKFYIGFDVSSAAISLCKKSFREDNSKVFKTNEEYKDDMAELALSLDVIFHLVEDDIYQLYMKRLFTSSKKFVIIYSSNIDIEPSQHERHRIFTTYVEKNFPDWKLLQHIPNKYPFSGNIKKGSMSDFYIYKKSFKN